MDENVHRIGTYLYKYYIEVLKNKRTRREMDGDAQAGGQSSKRARVDATSDARVLGLPEVTASDVLQSECAICLQDWGADEETLRAMPCSHAFHQLQVALLKRRCPLCRHRLPTAPTPNPTPEEEDEEQEEEEEHEQEGGGEVEDWEWEDGTIGGESS
ncbi:hypothetical protein SETIT_3G157000v2 [Setaria italica]|uniref:RING-type domain-containing protein n=1 Tax=Setaria italica TaxID=4555 RepID=A0A368QFB4_SETIT|nr:hypothetical protein SETIT_3G157000v2 [Setaria italica]